MFLFWPVTYIPPAAPGGGATGGDGPMRGAGNRCHVPRACDCVYSTEDLKGPGLDSANQHFVYK